MSGVLVANSVVESNNSVATSFSIRAAEFYVLLGITQDEKDDFRKLVSILKIDKSLPGAFFGVPTESAFLVRSDSRHHFGRNKVTRKTRSLKAGFSLHTRSRSSRPTSCNAE